MPEAQEALKEDNMMVDLDTSGNAIDVAEACFQVRILRFFFPFFFPDDVANAKFY